MNNSNKELFSQAISEALSSKYENELEKINESIVCSDSHYKKMSRILGFRVRKKHVSISFTKKALVAIIITISMLLLLGCTTYIYHEEIRGFIERIYEKYIKVTYNNNDYSEGSAINNVYVVSYVPNDYTLCNETTNTLLVFYEWRNDSGDIITFEQLVLDSTEFLLDVEQGNTLFIEEDGRSIYYRNIDSSHYYIWNDGMYAMTLTLSSELSSEEIMQIINSVSEKE